MWRAKNWKSRGSTEHLEKLEQALKKSKGRDQGLETHLRRLKVGWGKACDIPNQAA